MRYQPRKTVTSTLKSCSLIVAQAQVCAFFFLAEPIWDIIWAPKPFGIINLMFTCFNLFYPFLSTFFVGYGSMQDNCPAWKNSQDSMGNISKWWILHSQFGIFPSNDDRWCNLLLSKILMEREGLCGSWLVWKYEIILGIPAGILKLLKALCTMLILLNSCKLRTSFQSQP